MNEIEAILKGQSLSSLEKLSYYMEYFCNCLPKRTSISFEIFCSDKNIIQHYIGENWQENGFASKEWINLSAGSLYHSIYHNLNLKL